MIVQNPARSDAVADQATWRFALADGGLVLLLVGVSHGIGGDGRARFDALAQLLDGRGWLFSPYSIIGPLFSTPLFLLGKLVYDPGWWCAIYNSVLLAIGAIVLGRWIGRVAGRGVAASFVVLLVVASMFPSAVRGYYGETFTAIAVAIGFALLIDGRLAAGGIIVGLGVANTPATALGLLLVTVAMVWDARRLRYALPLVVAALLIVAESWTRRGGPFVSGYAGNGGAPTVLPYSGHLGFSYPLLLGVLSILLSFGKGLLFYAPGLLVPFAREAPGKLRAWWRYLILFVAGTVIVYARWWAWYGGWTWGPRFFLAASIPASLTVALVLERFRTLRTPTLAFVAVVLAVSIWVGIDGGTFDQANMDMCLANGYALEFLCWYVPEFSALWRPFVAPSPLSPKEWLFVVYCVFAGGWLIAPVLRELAGRAVLFVSSDVRERLRGLTW